MKFFLLMMRHEKIDFSTYSPDDFQRIMGDFDKWNRLMIDQGKLVASGNLKDREGKVFKSTQSVQDGPYGEAREAVTGFFILRAKDYDEASHFAALCPFLPRGGSVELRWMPELEFENVAQEIVTDLIAARLAKEKQQNAGKA